ncbi:MAG: phage shock protein PspA [Desulfobulbaceae bacterium]|jgi:phage shock protein A|nr:phage shock protein PspA [Desulfobulbaceae bacterium]
MGIFTRFRDIVSANINAMLDSAEDPEKMIKMMIREMEDTLIELKSSCAAAIASRKKLQRRLTDIEERQRLWEERAALAVERGRDNLAREALIEKRRYSEGLDALRDELVEHGQVIDQYQSDIEELEKKLHHAKDKKRILAERHRQAVGRKRAQSDIRHADSAEAMSRFEALENRIERMEAEADLVNPRRQPSLDDDFAHLTHDEEIEKELARLKGKKSGQTKTADAIDQTDTGAA